MVRMLYTMFFGHLLNQYMQTVVKEGQWLDTGLIQTLCTSRLTDKTYSSAAAKCPPFGISGRKKHGYAMKKKFITSTLIVCYPSVLVKAMDFSLRLSVSKNI
jgi:hypothetical protein